MSELFAIDKADGGRRGRSATRAVATSDIWRVRDMAFAAVVAAIALGLAIVFVPSPSGLRAPGPLARPHVEAKLACATCHAERADGKGPQAACAGCHGGALHASTRTAHRALAAKGQLGCATCHPAHGDARGVTFGADGAYLAWASGTEVTGKLAHAAPAGVTVPLVPATRCTGCHTDGARDPLAACMAGGAITTCFDEHRRADEANPGAAAGAGVVCARQHGSARYVAWEAAREVVRSTTPSPAVRGPHVAWAWVGIALGAASSSLGGMGLLRRVRRRRDARRSPSVALVPAERIRLPQINTATCIGCYACVDACPFDVLEIQRYIAVVVRPADCCGVVLCQQACPNGSLVITEGEPIEQRPNVDQHLESRDVPGVFLAGDLTGLPLIKNAINQGRRVANRVAATLPAKERANARKGDEVDLVIVGAGPAGISASLRAKELGLSHVVLEQGSVAASVKSFPRNKLVFDQPLDLPVEGEMWLRESTKEELLAQWARIVRAHKLPIREGRRVTTITRENGRFSVTSMDASGGVPETIRAARLVLSTGKRGTPRALGAEIGPGADRKVSYALADARSFEGQRVLVVGLGDSAMEAVVALARQPKTTLVVSYRGADYTRGKARNVAEMKRLVAKGIVTLRLESEVLRIDPDTVTLASKGRRDRLEVDAVLVLIGGVTSWELVRQAGVQLVAQLRSAGENAAKEDEIPANSRPNRETARTIDP